MNLVQFKYTKAVATNGSFSKSAKACNVSQPTISNAISDLEQELGVNLFRRTTRFVEPTPFGLSIIKHIDIILDLIENIESEAESKLRPQRKALKIALSPIVDGPRIMSKFKQFEQKIQDCSFVFKECSVNELESNLEEDKVDIICGVKLADEIKSGRSVLYHDFLRFIPQGGLEKFTGDKSITIEDAAKDDLILATDYCGLSPFLRALFNRLKLPLNEYAGNPFSYSTIIEWANENIGASILPESRIPGDASAYPIVTNKGYPVMIAIEAVWSRSNTVPEHLKEFTTFLNSLSLSGMLNFQLSQSPKQKKSTNTKIKKDNKSKTIYPDRTCSH